MGPERIGLRTSEAQDERVANLVVTFGVGGLLELLGVAGSPQARESLVVVVLAAGVIGAIILFFLTRSYGVRRGWVGVRQAGSQLGLIDGTGQ